MQRNKRIIITILGIGALVTLVMGVGLIFIFFSHQAERTSIVDLVFPSDVDGDGTNELVVAYAGARTYPSIIEAEHLATDSVRWDTEMYDVEGFEPYQAPTFAVGSGRVVFTRSAYLAKKKLWVRSATAVSQKTGIQAWEHTMPSGREWAVCPIIVAGDTVYLVTTQGGAASTAERPTYLTALVAETGEPRWEKPLPTALYYAFFALGDTIVAWGMGSAAVVAPTDGTITTVPVAGKPLILGDEVYTIVETSPGAPTLAKLDIAKGTTTAITYQGAPVAMPGKGMDPYGATGLHGGSVVTIIDGASSQKLVAIPYSDGGPSYTSDLPQGFGVTGLFLGKSPTASGELFGAMTTRYVPMILRSEGKPSAQLLVLAVVDLDTGAITWQSKPLEGYGGRITSQDLFYASGRWLAWFPYDLGPDTYRSTLLVLDGATGSFTSALKVTWAADEGQGFDGYLKAAPWLVDGDTLYGFKGPRTWAIDLKGPTVTYSNEEGLSLVQAWSEIEPILGPLPP